MSNCVRTFEKMMKKVKETNNALLEADNGLKVSNEKSHWRSKIAPVKIDLSAPRIKSWSPWWGAKFGVM
jgi:hypothetical protein